MTVAADQQSLTSASPVDFRHHKSDMGSPSLDCDQSVGLNASIDRLHAAAAEPVLPVLHASLDDTCMRSLRIAAVKGLFFLYACCDVFWQIMLACCGHWHDTQYLAVLSWLQAVFQTGTWSA